ncbi:MAG: ATP-binding protein [Vicinamibacterales bacterium]
MKRWFSTLPIHRKLTVLAMGVSASALVAGILGFTIFDGVRFRNAAVADAQGLAQVLSENIAAAIVFDDADAAQATLASVASRPAFIRACAFRADGSLLASFARSGEQPCTGVPAELLSWREVVGRVPVQRNGREVGSVIVERDLSDLGSRVVATASMGLLMLFIGGLTALGVAGALQRLISKPIVALAQAARAVGLDPGYELPQIQAPPDETGDLVRAFSDMVRRINETTSALVESNAALRLEIDQRRQMQQERDAVLAREREASRLKDEFLAAVSHELRTPLNAILGWAQILQSTNPSRETLERGLASVARNAQAQSRVVEDLLDISRIITGKLQLTMREIDLREVVDAALEVVAAGATARNITLVVSRPSEPCRVRGDSDRLRQVLWNLLSNALKFTPPGGTVTVALHEEADACVITVRDNGVGISPSFLPHVFERFRQADGSMTREQGGLGLGLAIVKELTELQGGTVQADSSGPGAGASFTVRLPRANPVPLVVPAGDSAGRTHLAGPGQQPWGAS